MTVASSTSRCKRLERLRTMTSVKRPRTIWDRARSADEEQQIVDRGPTSPTISIASGIPNENENGPSDRDHSRPGPGAAARMRDASSSGTRPNPPPQGAPLLHRRSALGARRRYEVRLDRDEVVDQLRPRIASSKLTVVTTSSRSKHERTIPTGAAGACQCGQTKLRRGRRDRRRRRYGSTCTPSGSSHDGRRKSAARSGDRRRSQCRMGRTRRRTRTGIGSAAQERLAAYRARTGRRRAKYKLPR